MNEPKDEPTIKKALKIIGRKLVTSNSSKIKLP